MILIWILAAFAFLGMAIYLITKDREQSLETVRIFERLNALTSDIGYIYETGYKTVESQLGNAYVGLKHISHVFKYEEENDYWITFVLTNRSTINCIFLIKDVQLHTNDGCFLSEKTLLFEKVPEHYAPPYGNLYFDIRSYNGYVLGEKGMREFRFQSSFKREEFIDTDYLAINIEVHRLDNERKKYDLVEQSQLVESLKNIKFSRIQSIKDKIKIEHQETSYE